MKTQGRDWTTIEAVYQLVKTGSAERQAIESECEKYLGEKLYSEAINGRRLEMKWRNRPVDRFEGYHIYNS